MAATTHEVLTHHLDTFGKGDLTGVMADYSPESRLFTPNGMLTVSYTHLTLPTIYSV